MLQEHYSVEYEQCIMVETVGVEPTSLPSLGELLNNAWHWEPCFRLLGVAYCTVAPFPATPRWLKTGTARLAGYWSSVFSIW